MSLRSLAKAVMSQRGIEITDATLNGLSDSMLCEISGLPLPKTLSLPKEATRIDFHCNSKGSEKLFFKVDKRGLAKSLRKMRDKDEVVMHTKKMLVKFDFGLETSRVVGLINKRYWTRSDIVNAVAAEFQKMWLQKKRYGMWAKINRIRVNTVYFNERDNVYYLDIDLM